MPTIIEQGNRLTDGSEQTLLSITDAGIYQAFFSLANMAASDQVRWRTKQAVLAAGTKQTSLEETFTDAQADPDNQIATIQLWCPQGLDLTVQSLAGVERTYEWSVIRVANLEVIDSGTKALDGTEQTFGAAYTTNRTFGLLTDHDAQIGGDTTITRAKTKVRASSTAQELFRNPLTGALVAPNIIQQSVPVAAPHSMEFTIEKTAGANHNVPYAVLAVN